MLLVLIPKHIFMRKVFDELLTNQNKYSYFRVTTVEYFPSDKTSLASPTILPSIPG